MLGKPRSHTQAAFRHRIHRLVSPKASVSTQTPSRDLMVITVHIKNVPTRTLHRSQLHPHSATALHFKSSFTHCTVVLCLLDVLFTYTLRSHKVVVPNLDLTSLSSGKIQVRALPTLHSKYKILVFIQVTVYEVILPILGKNSYLPTRF